MMKKTVLTLALPCAAAMLLAACKPDEAQTQQENSKATTPEVIDISNLSASNWVDEKEMTNAEVIPSSDVLAENNMVILDMSGSMADESCSGKFPRRAEAAKESLFTWIKESPKGNIGLVTFNSEEGARKVIGLGSGRAHAEKMIGTIQALAPASGTPLMSAIGIAEQALKEQYIRQQGTGTYRIIIITDGEASNGQDPTKLVRRIAENPANPIELHTVGFCIRGSHSLNNPQWVFYADANSPEEIVAALKSTTGEDQAFDSNDTAFEGITQ